MVDALLSTPNLFRVLRAFVPTSIDLLRGICLNVFVVGALLSLCVLRDYFYIVICLRTGWSSRCVQFSLGETVAHNQHKERSPWVVAYIQIFCDNIRAFVLLFLFDVLVPKFCLGIQPSRIFDSADLVEMKFRNRHNQASRFSSTSRRTSSATVIPSSLARASSHFIWGAVKAIDLRRVLTVDYIAPPGEAV